MSNLLKAFTGTVLAMAPCTVEGLSAVLRHPTLAGVGGGRQKASGKAWVKFLTVSALGEPPGTWYSFSPSVWLWVDFMGGTKKRRTQPLDLGLCTG